MDIRHLNLEDRRLTYAWSHGPVARPLVVLHGLGDSSIETYAPIFASSELRHTPTLFIDLPGFGRGSAEDSADTTIETLAADVYRLLSHLNLNGCMIFAHSMGANVAIQLARMHPNAASLLILAEPLLDPAHSILATSIAKHSEASFVERRHVMMVRAASMQASRGDVAAMAFLPTLQMANPVAMYRAAASLVAERDPSFLSMLRDISTPAHILMGGNTKVDLTELKLESIPVISIANAGHSMMVEQSAKTACAILDIVNRSSGQPRQA